MTAGSRPAGVQRVLPQSEAVAVYTCLPAAVYVWSITGEGTALARVSIEASKLHEHVQRFGRGIASDSVSELAQLSEPLVDALWRPIESTIPPETTVTVIGDDVMEGLPFGALLDARTGRYLVERNAFAVSDSVAKVLRYWRGVGKKRGPEIEGALVVGDPAIDPARFSELQRLPRAVDEARSVAALYSTSTCLTGEAATKNAFVDSAVRADVIHFAGHAVMQADDVTEPALLLAARSIPEPDSGILFASTVARWRLSRTRLVVLAACGTAASDSSVPASATLARAFLAAGADEVVASRWAVADAATEALFREFHQRVRSGEAVPMAMRRAVLMVLDGPERSGVRPRDWSAFEVFR